MADIKDLIAATAKKDVTGFKAAFEDLMKAKLTDALVAKEESIATEQFPPEDEDDDEDWDEDDIEK